ncbi:hypothetical protein, partial [Streptomyces californicus]|uniref:hypothetical protein n=1 Tax=Streptomyces californicus TaxID=67351 RepID=UPI0033E88D7C
MNRTPVSFRTPEFLCGLNDATAQCALRHISRAPFDARSCRIPAATDRLRARPGRLTLSKHPVHGLVLTTTDRPVLEEILRSKK